MKYPEGFKALPNPTHNARRPFRFIAGGGLILIAYLAVVKYGDISDMIPVAWNITMNVTVALSLGLGVFFMIRDHEKLVGAEVDMELKYGTWIRSEFSLWVKENGLDLTEEENYNLAAYGEHSSYEKTPFAEEKCFIDVTIYHVAEDIATGELELRNSKEQELYSTLSNRYPH